MTTEPQTTEFALEATALVPELTILGEFIRQIRSDEPETMEALRLAQNQVLDLIRKINKD